jgi:hypothetical protein
MNQSAPPAAGSPHSSMTIQQIKASPTSSNGALGMKMKQELSESVVMPSTIDNTRKK